MRAPLYLLLYLLCAPACDAAQVTVFAAASLNDTLKEIAAVYERGSTNHIIFNFAASGVLARQIEEGAPADIFFSADEARANALDSKQLLESNSRINRLGNSLVCVALTNSAVVIPSAQSLTNTTLTRIALGDPKTVPAGTYAKEYLDRLQLWNAVQNRVVPCESVRAVLAAVQSGNVDAGIVYKTDVAIAKNVRVFFEVPKEEGPVIHYPMALVKNRPQPEASRQFFDYLKSAEAGVIFAKFGFVVLEK